MRVHANALMLIIELVEKRRNGVVKNFEIFRILEAEVCYKCLGFLVDNSYTVLTSIEVQQY